MEKGIDISYWQGDVDFSKVAKNVDFVILREGYRKTIDEKFLAYVKGCKENEIQLEEYIIFVMQHRLRGQEKRQLLA